MRGRGGRAGPGRAGRPSLCCPVRCTGTWWAPRRSSTCRRRRASAAWAKVSSSRTCCGPARRRALPSSVPSPPAPSPSSCAPRRNKSAPRGVPIRPDGLSKCLTPRRRTAAACQRGLRRRTEAASSRRRPQVSAGTGKRAGRPGRGQALAIRGFELRGAAHLRMERARRSVAAGRGDGSNCFFRSSVRPEAVREPRARWRGSRAALPPSERADAMFRSQVYFLKRRVCFA